MGTPDFAVETLKTLVENKVNVVAVITAPDKPAGRGQKLRETPVKKYAVEQGIPVLQPTRLKSPDFLEELASYKADLQVVVAFRMLPEMVWNMPTKGTFNLHGSLLPQYRGAAPINWAIINGEKETGVTTFFIEKEIDTGHIMFSEKLPIREDMSAGELHDEMMVLGANLVLKTVRAIEADDYPQIPQSELFNSEDELKPAPKIFKETCEIDWSKETESLYNLIRGLSPYPAAWTTLQEKTLKIYQTQKLNEKPEGDLVDSSLTEVISNGKDLLAFKTADGWLGITELQLEGKRRMTTEEFLRGFRF
ncbi:methionyl-tRNA formyltransferase [Jiulongibacter sediminis]|uniref:Methionyl-tRNA formyltransferase n=2 Tax=Jiulongibacter sediminis TaxID=1605367 RepID=A0A0P7C6X0_9BACT|nr:methionyl-tRNA formyltransferase [Jiulongibacter sediminis]TBX24287.1 methionyl-tRNA formyltransferase [Jiulongibacter sediminis]